MYHPSSQRVASCTSSPGGPEAAGLYGYPHGVSCSSTNELHPMVLGSWWHQGHPQLRCLPSPKAATRADGAEISLPFPPMPCHPAPPMPQLTMAISYEAQEGHPVRHPPSAGSACERPTEAAQTPQPAGRDSTAPQRICIWPKVPAPLCSSAHDARDNPSRVVQSAPGGDVCHCGEVRGAVTCCTCSRTAASCIGSPHSRSAVDSSAPAPCCSPALPEQEGREKREIS